MKIAVLCPSRGRPDRFLSFLQSVISTTDKIENVEVWLALDSDDPKKEMYPTACPVLGVECGPRKSVPALFRQLADRIDADIYVTGSDDVMFRTPGWDAALAARYEDEKSWLAYFDDGRGRNKVEHFACTRAFKDAVGYFMHPDYEHFYADQHMGDIAERAGCLVHMPKIILEHMHAKYGKAEWDETYKRTRANGVGEHDANLYQNLTSHRIERAGVVRSLSLP